MERLHALEERVARIEANHEGMGPIDAPPVPAVLIVGAHADELERLRAALDRSTRELVAAEADRDRYIERVKLLERRIASAESALRAPEGYVHPRGKL